MQKVVWLLNNITMEHIPKQLAIEDDSATCEFYKILAECPNTNPLRDPKRCFQHHTASNAPPNAPRNAPRDRATRCWASTVASLRETAKQRSLQAQRSRDSRREVHTKELTEMEGCVSSFWLASHLAVGGGTFS